MMRAKRILTGTSGFCFRSWASSASPFFLSSSLALFESPAMSSPSLGLRVFVSQAKLGNSIIRRRVRESDDQSTGLGLLSGPTGRRGHRRWPCRWPTRHTNTHTNTHTHTEWSKRNRKETWNRRRENRRRSQRQSSSCLKRTTASDLKMATKTTRIGQKGDEHLLEPQEYPVTYHQNGKFQRKNKETRWFFSFLDPGLRP